MKEIYFVYNGKSGMIGNAYTIGGAKKLSNEYDYLKGKNFIAKMSFKKYINFLNNHTITIN